jgi:5-methyltetrahydrofolate--homocysteine methyltransferase
LHSSVTRARQALRAALCRLGPYTASELCLNKSDIIFSHMADSEKTLERIADFIVSIGAEGIRIRDLVQQAIKQGIPPYEILTKGMIKGITVVGEKYENGEYFLTELIGAGEIMKEGMEEISPLLSGKEVRPLGKVVIGTVRGDLHDIGKNIVKMLLESTGFAVYDLGVDVLPERFVEEIQRIEADILGMSALLTTTTASMKRTIDELVRTGIRDEVKVIIGGAPVTNEFAREIGADSAAMDAAQGVRICREWMKKGV